MRSARKATSSAISLIIVKGSMCLSLGPVLLSVNTADGYTTPKKSSPAKNSLPWISISRFNSYSCHGAASGS